MVPKLLLEHFFSEGWRPAAGMLTKYILYLFQKIMKKFTEYIVNKILCFIKNSLSIYFIILYKKNNYKIKEIFVKKL